MEREVCVRTYKLPLCEDCGEGFESNEDFRQHLMTRHGSRHTQESPTPPCDGDDQNVANIHHSTTSTVSDDRTFVVTQREQLHSHQADSEAISTGLVEYQLVEFKVEPPSEPVEFPTEVTVKVEPLPPGDLHTQEAVNLYNNCNNCVGPILGTATKAQQTPSHEEGSQHQAYIGDAPFTQFQPQPPPDHHHHRQQQSEEVLTGLASQLERYKLKMMETQRDLEHQLEQAQREAREAQAELMKMKVSQEQLKKAFNDDGSANETSCSGCVPESSFDSTNSDDDLPGLSKSREKRQESMQGLDLEMTNNMKRTLGNDSSSANKTSGSEWLPDSSSDCTESDDEPPGMSKSRNETRDPHGESVQGLDKESSEQDAFQRDSEGQDVIALLGQQSHQEGEIRTETKSDSSSRYDVEIEVDTPVKNEAGGSQDKEESEEEKDEDCKEENEDEEDEDWLEDEDSEEDEEEDGDRNKADDGEYESAQ
ncbi:uncharacterized protein [Diadema antillarum]|uniref:uncharacterized protein n=1 Tax=Diadema antillarum TaxID=105358 RepID=UPI003A84267B